MPRDLVVYGLSHHAAPVELRERLAASPERAPEELRALVQGGPFGEGVLLSTCNRVEMIATTSEPHRGREHVLSSFNRKAAPERVDSYLYEHRGLDAVRHLFRVASGLDSMVLGEPQILGQVNERPAADCRREEFFEFFDAQGFRGHHRRYIGDAATGQEFPLMYAYGATRVCSGGAGSRERLQLVRLSGCQAFFFPGATVEEDPLLNSSCQIMMLRC